MAVTSARCRTSLELEREEDERFFFNEEEEGERVVIFSFVWDFLRIDFPGEENETWSGKSIILLYISLFGLYDKSFSF